MIGRQPILEEIAHGDPRPRPASGSHLCGVSGPPIPGGLGHFAVTMDGQGPDPAPAADLVRAQGDPHLPHTGSTLTQRSASSRSSHTRGYGALAGWG